VFRKDISGTNFKNFKKRDAFSKVFDFVTGDECRSGKILVLYGLSGTGKTAIMEQTLSEYPNPDECVMYERTNIGTVYINITDFLLSIDKQRDMDKVMEELTEGLSVQDNF
jgi:DNA replication protein DnaC